DEVAEVRVLLFTNRRLQRDGLLRQLEDAANLRDGHVNLRRDLLGRRLAAEFLHEGAARAYEFVDGLDHVDGYADSPCLIRNSALLFNLLEASARGAQLALQLLLDLGLDALVLQLVAELLYLSLFDAHLLVRPRDGVNQTLARRLLHVEVLHLLRDFEPRARDLTPESQELLRLLAARELILGGELLPLLQTLFEVLPYVLDAFERPLQILVGLVLCLGHVCLVGEVDHVAYAELTRLQLLADAYEFLDRDG